MNTSSAQIFGRRRDGVPVFLGRVGTRRSRWQPCDVITLNCVGQMPRARVGIRSTGTRADRNTTMTTATTRMPQCMTTTNSNTQATADHVRIRRFSLANDEARTRTQDSPTTKNNTQPTTHDNKQHDRRRNGALKAGGVETRPSRRRHTTLHVCEPISFESARGFARIKGQTGNMGTSKRSTIMGNIPEGRRRQSRRVPARQMTMTTKFKSSRSKYEPLQYHHGLVD